MTDTTAPVYAPGETVRIYTDLHPAAVSPRPAGVPNGVKLRAVVTERALTLLWQTGSGPSGPSISRMDIPMTDEQTRFASYLGGNVGEYNVVRGSGCSCGGRAVRGYSPFPGVNLVQATGSAASARPYGVPPQRYARSRG